jgi:hypothetical protein
MGIERREFAGGVIAQTLSANISNSATTFSVADGSTFPTGDGDPFAIVIARGTANEEKMLISVRVDNLFYVGNRGYDGTIAKAHTIGDVVDHILDSNTIQSMNTVVFDTQIFQWMGI